MSKRGKQVILHLSVGPTAGQHLTVTKMITCLPSDGTAQGSQAVLIREVNTCTPPVKETKETLDVA